ncbi:pneumococcal serine-rich repeat protein-like [Daphnia carinata]|uniref:pneumococcal serine-rich repeat protein-like n=1 Tax=Daphnia carinata TaxID=120202 RepID=UPI00257E7F9B|nr:pneumococcal serine-rich repeat protein-like [Daphnia carinata]
MNSHQQMQRVSELRMRRWGRHEASASSSISASELELSLRTASLNTSFSTSETICETATTTSSPSTRERRSGGSFNVTSRTASTASSDSPVNFEFCRAGSSTGQSNYHGGGGGSRAASPLLNGSSPCPSPTPRSPRSPMTPRSSRSPCRSPSSQQPSPGHQTPTSASPHPYSSRRRSGVATGNLARLASRRSSRDSEAGEPSPLQCVRNNQRRTSNFLEIPDPVHFRPRVCSLPENSRAPYNPRSRDDIYRLRNFSITSKGVVNRGDALISRHSRSNTSINSTLTALSSRSGRSRSGERSFGGSCCGSSYVSSEESSDHSNTKYRVVMLGAAGVGKTALVSQFMTSEYMNTYDASLDDEFGEKTVSVLLDGEESEMIFIDHASAEMSVENCLTTYDPHAFVLIYSITDRGSFQFAEEVLKYLWQESCTKEKAVILVGNKVDLARSRIIKCEDGKKLATEHDCKFIETSSGIQHNVDELLVGVLKQIRLREDLDKKRRKKKLMGSGSRTSLSLGVARDILQKMCLQDNRSKSCENLLVL